MHPKKNLDSIGSIKPAGPLNATQYPTALFLFLVLGTNPLRAEEALHNSIDGPMPLQDELSVSSAATQSSSKEVEVQKFIPPPQLLTALPQLIEESRKQGLSKSTQWLRLGHYRKRWLGGVQSEVDGKDFFLHAKGKTQPDLELEATLTAFVHDPNTLCKFPARYLYLDKKLGLVQAGLSRPACEKFDAYAEDMHSDGVSYVFSAYYLNNPSSTFGHNFLRFHRTEDRGDHARTRSYELLDRGINYSAMTPPNPNPIAFAVKGLTGLYEGRFTKIPFYYKIREYNDYEARDLWSYELNLDSAQRELLIAHLWELGDTHFDYFFLSENCAYHIVAAVEAVLPESTELLSQLPFYVIPADTVKVLERTPGLVKKITYRPSIRAEFEERLKPLFPEERKLVKKMLDAPLTFQLPEQLSIESKRRIADAALDGFDYRNPDVTLEKNADLAKQRQALLLVRARLAVASPKLEIPTPNDQMPHLAHGSTRWSLGSGLQSQPQGASSFSGMAYASLGFRFALHDVLDPTLGLPKGSAVEFLNFEARLVPQTPWLTVERARVISVANYSPLKDLDAHKSFRFDVGWRRIVDGNCADSNPRCLATGVDVGYGLTFGFDSAAHLKVFLMGQQELMAATDFALSSVRYGAGITSGIIGNWNQWSLLSQVDLRAFAFSREIWGWNWNTEARLHLSKEWSIAALGQLTRLGYHEAGLRLLHSF
jgi:hypothetical protein